MENKNFIQGLLYGLAVANSVTHSDNTYLDIRCNPIHIHFVDGSYLKFAINRGISHIYGNFTAMLTGKKSCNLFDIVPQWQTPEQVQRIEKMGFDFSDGEIRVTLDEIIRISEQLGAIDVEKTKEEWLKVFLAVYYRK
jgi:hypothetical protein